MSVIYAAQTHVTLRPTEEQVKVSDVQRPTISGCLNRIITEMYGYSSWDLLELVTWVQSPRYLSW
jgi:hypothetical protein